MKFAPLLLLALAGCSTATLDCADATRGACKVHFTRLATDVSASLTWPNGGGLTYSSNPQAQATAEAFAAINRLAGLVGTVAAGRLPVPGNPEPLVQPQPFIPGPDSDVDEPEERSRGPVAPRACPAAHRPARVTAATPWMAEGLAMAGQGGAGRGAI